MMMRPLHLFATGLTAVFVFAAAYVCGGVSPAAAVQVMTPEAGGLSLEVNKGLLVRLDRPASTVFVADPEIADIQVKSPRLVYLFGKTPGETTLYAADSNENLLATKQIVVSHNLSRLRGALEELLPRRGLRVVSVDGSLMLTGAVLNSREAEDARALAARFVGKDETVINRLQIEGPNQIQIRVRVAEVSRDIIKQIGINWDSVFANGNFLFGLATGNPVLHPFSFISPGDPRSFALVPTGDPRFMGVVDPVQGLVEPFVGKTFLPRNPGPSQTTTNSLFGSYSSGSIDLNAMIDALDEEGFISVLAEPNLTAMSGETASFLAGGEFPIPVPQDNNTITIEFKKFGVALSFTPTLVGGRINLRVMPEVSELSNAGAIQFAGITIPALTTRRAETTVELGSGQSFAVAGLLQNNTIHDINKFPGLGDLPVIGALFRSDTFQKSESELVIIVTPYVVRPSSGPLTVPTDGLVMPTDYDRYINSHQYQQRLPEGGVAPRGNDGATLTGAIGFVVE